MHKKINDIEFLILFSIVLGLSSLTFIQDSYALTPAINFARITGPTTITIEYDQNVNSVLGDYTNLVIGGNSKSISSISGSGTDTITITFSGAVGTDATGTIDISGVDDTLLAFLPLSVTGQVLADAQAPTLTSATITNTNTLVLVYSETVTTTVSDYSNLVISGTPRTVSSVSGSGTNTITITFGGQVFVNEVGTLDISNSLVDTSSLTNSITAITGRALVNGVNLSNDNRISVDSKVKTRMFDSLRPTLNFVQVNGFTSSENFNLESKVPTQYVKVDETFDFSLDFPADQSQYLHKLQLYLNLRGTEHEIHQSDTYIQYDKFKPLVVNDPHGYFSDVDVKNKVENGISNYKFSIEFNKAMENSKLILQYIDELGNYKRIGYDAALQVVDETFEPPAKLKETIEKEQKTTSSDIVLQQNLDEGIITNEISEEAESLSLVSESSVSSTLSVPDSVKKNIPSGIKKEANFWANGIQSNNEFAKSLKHLAINGFLTTSIESIDSKLATISEELKNSDLSLDFTKTSDEDFLSMLNFLLDDSLIDKISLFENVLTIDDALEQIDKIQKINLKETLKEFKEEQIKVLNQWSENGWKIDSNLFSLVTSLDPQQEAKRLGLTYENGKTKVILSLSEDNPELIEKIQTLGHIDFVSGDLVQMTLSLDKLSELVEYSEIQSLRTPYIPLQHEFSISGVEFVNADLLHLIGNAGSGVKVAVIDFAFDLNNPKLLSNIEYAKSFRYGIDDSPLQLAGLGSESLHGTAVAELILDTAPGSELYLYSIGNDLEFTMAMKDAVENKVDIITIPLGWPNLPTNGASHITTTVNDASKNEIIVVVPSGNLAQNHWEERYHDANSNNWNEFTPDDEGLTFNITQERINSNKPLVINLLWENESNEIIDFDMVLIGQSNEIVSYSTNVQDDQNDITFEQIRYLPSKTGTYSIGILYDGTPNPNIPIEIFSINDELEHFIAAGSVVTPADASNVIVVGAINMQSGKIESFTSRGPTNNGFTVPLMLAPNGVSTTAYGDKLFYGTSAATPYVAGIVALVLEIDPNVSVEEILKQIEENPSLQTSDPTTTCDGVEKCGIINAELVIPWEKIR